MTFLEEDERRAVGFGARDRELDHTSDWVMFTPTELLKLYVKEAFNREGIPAPDDRISTWSDYMSVPCLVHDGLIQPSATKC